MEFLFDENLTADENLDRYFDFLHSNKDENTNSIRNNYMKCEVCCTDLLLDERNNYNICAMCGICYPYCDYNVNKRRSPMYKRKWHLMTKIRQLDFYINSDDLDKILYTFIKLDHIYAKNFPKKNMINLLFTIKYICNN